MNAHVETRRRLHREPELAFDERATGDLAAGLLAGWGYEVSRGLAGTGVVATMRRGRGPSIGLRAELDALALDETTGAEWSSERPGVMHACGHDGHLAMLLAGAERIAQRTSFAGTVHIILQPGEEGAGGAARMIADGLFDQHPCDTVYAIHNAPTLDVGTFGLREGPMMASSDWVRIALHGRGGHGALPHVTADPIVALGSVILALQTVVARNVDPQETGIVSIGTVSAGSAINAIPASAHLQLTARATTAEVREVLRRRIIDIVTAQAASFGVRAEIDYDEGYPVLVNDPAATAVAVAAATDAVGAQSVRMLDRGATASDDFAEMLRVVPGSYVSLGNGLDSPPLHSPGYDFDDRNIEVGAAFWAALVARSLPAPGESSPSPR